MIHAGYFLYIKKDWVAFKSHSIDYKISLVGASELKTAAAIHSSSNISNAFPYLANDLSNCTIDQSGTATSPTESDNTGIETIQVSPSVYPSHGDSKGTDIHRKKGGRSMVRSSRDNSLTDIDHHYQFLNVLNHERQRPYSTTNKQKT
jgi:hypothetical protein